jgi:hypothetical protein
MNLKGLFHSPEFYPIILDMEKRVIRFVRMSPENYRNSVFLDLRTHHSGGQTYEIKLDDLLLAASVAPQATRRVHYILNCAYCCSTLLARYFELLPSCFVLKEPRLLAQIGLMDHSEPSWKPIFELCIRLLSRTYEPNQLVVMKPVDCTSLIGQELLGQNPHATITFLMVPLRKFILSILKSGERRDWARTRIRTVFKRAASWEAMAGVQFGELKAAEAAAGLWLVQRYLSTQLCAGRSGSRMLVLNGDDVANFPAEALPSVATLCGLSLDRTQLEWMIHHPSVIKYSKDLSRPYDADSRTQEMTELERCWGAEADRGIEWAERHRWDKGEPLSTMFDSGQITAADAICANSGA